MAYSGPDPASVPGVAPRHVPDAAARDWRRRHRQRAGVYDFAVYAFLATVLARKTFPSGDELSALLATSAVFGVGFVVRPFGGIIIGRLALRAFGFTMLWRKVAN